jgi:hypothetical protein
MLPVIPSDSMNKGELVGEGVEGSDWDIMPKFPEGTWVTTEIRDQDSRPVSEPKFVAWIPRIQNGRSTHSTATFEFLMLDFVKFGTFKEVLGPFVRDTV